MVLAWIEHLLGRAGGHTLHVDIQMYADRYGRYTTPRPAQKGDLRIVDTAPSHGELQRSVLRRRFSERRPRLVAKLVVLHIEARERETAGFQGRH